MTCSPSHIAVFEVPAQDVKTGSITLTNQTHDILFTLLVYVTKSEFDW